MLSKKTYKKANGVLKLKNGSTMIKTPRPRAIKKKKRTNQQGLQLV